MKFDRISTRLVIALVIFVSVHFALEHLTVLTIRLEMSVDHPSVTQVFWKQGKEIFNEKQSVTFSNYRNWNTYKITPTTKFDAIRIDPANITGPVTIHKVEVTNGFYTLYSAGGAKGFLGWTTNKELSDIKISDGSLSMMATGNDPHLESSTLSSIYFEQNIFNAFVALIAAALFLIIFYIVKKPKRMSLKLTEQHKSILLATVTTLVGAVIVFVTYKKLFTPTKINPPIIEYEQTLVDHFGNSISPKPGSLKLALDPYTLFRNFPNQKTRYFKINENGYRGETLKGEKRPKVFILGGSAAFGKSLESDHEAIDAQLGMLNPRFRFVNAGVIAAPSALELSEMIHYADSFKPKAYISITGWNDFYVQYAWNKTFDHFGQNPHIFLEIEDRLLRYRMETSEPGATSVSMLSELTEAEKYKAAQGAFLNNLDKMNSFAQSRGAKYFVAFQPELGSKPKLTANEKSFLAGWAQQIRSTKDFTEKYKEWITQAKAFCKSKNIAFVDLNSEPRLLNYEGETFFDAVHPNAAATKIEAEILNDHFSP